MPITTAIITAVGVGIAAYSTYQSGKTQSAIAQYNAEATRDAAESNLRSVNAQVEIANANAEKEYLLRKAESDAKEANARTMENNALTQDSVNRSNLLKRREAFGEAMATQRANIAASGAVESSGTPLDLLAETAAKIQQDQEEQHYLNELNRRTLFEEAQQERLGGQFALVGATLERDSSLAAASLSQVAGYSSYLSSLRTAEIQTLTGKAAETSGTLTSAGTLLSGLGNAAYSYDRSTGGSLFKTS